jgi:hypothetical protein
MSRLTATALPRLPAGKHFDGGGLYLMVTASSKRTFHIRF